MDVRQRLDLHFDFRSGRLCADTRADPAGACAQELWDAWEFAAAEVFLAFEAWRGSARGERGQAYLAYTAALDREQAAADELALRVAPA